MKEKGNFSRVEMTNTGIKTASCWQGLAACLLIILLSPWIGKLLNKINRCMNSDVVVNTSRYFFNLSLTEILTFGIAFLFCYLPEVRAKIQRKKLGMFGQKVDFRFFRLAFAILFGSALKLFLAGVDTWWISAVPAANAVHAPLPTNFSEFALCVFALCIVSPVAEELFFRKIMQKKLSLILGNFGGMAMSAILFALCHGNLAGIISHVCFGLSSALLFAATDSAPFSIAFHIAFNTTALMFNLFGAVNSPLFVWTMIGGAVVSAVCISIMVCRFKGKKSVRKPSLPEYLLMIACLFFTIIHYF